MRRGMLIVLTALILAGDWPDFGLDAARTRSSPETVGATLSPGWQNTLGGTIVSSPAVAQGKVVIGGHDGFVRGLREADGVVQWEFNAGEVVQGTAAVAAGRVYVASHDGTLYALQLSNGAAVWTMALGGSVWSSPLIVGSTLYIGVGFPQNSVRAVDINTAATVWETPVGMPVYSSPTFDGASIWVGDTRGRYHRLDAATGAPISFTDTGGEVLMSGALPAFGQVFALPGGGDTSFRALGGGAVAITDPAPPAGFITGQRMATSSPMVAGGRVVGVVRFDYFVDTDADFIDDTYVMNEYVVGFNPAGPAIDWQVANGSFTGFSRNDIPLRGNCSTPVSCDGGTRLIVGSSTAANVRILDSATGAAIFTQPTDAPGRASPVVANTRVLWATDAGTVYSFATGNLPPLPPLSGFDPPDGSAPTLDVTAVSWAAAFDPNDGPATLTYTFRIDTDGEILIDWAEEIVTAAGVTSVTLGTPAVAPGVYSYAVRTQDPGGAQSAWSALQTFGPLDAPLPPTGLLATPSNAAVVLSWTASPSPGVVGYNVRWGPGAPSFTAATTMLVTGLTNGTLYNFDVRALDSDGDESVPALASAMPTDVGVISVNGVPFGSLGLAVAAAVPGDAILVGRGTFVVPPGMTLKGVSLVGVSPHDTWLNAGGLPVGITLQADPADTPMRLERFSIFGAAVGIEAQSGTALLTHLVIRDMSTAGVYVSGPAIVDIINNTVTDVGGAAIDARDGAVMVRNNILQKSWTGLLAVAPAAVTHRYNDVWENAYADFSGTVPSTGDFSAPVRFRDEPARDFRVLDGEPTVDAGDPADPFAQEPAPNGNRINVGAYGDTPWAAVIAVPAAAAGGGGRGGGGCSMFGVGVVGPPSWALLALLLFARFRRR